MEIISIIAIIVAPIAAVWIGQHLQNRAKRREDKMVIFGTLMTDRIYGWTEKGVHALNSIDIVFSDSKKVRNAWKEYRASLFVVNKESFNAKDAKTKQYKLLEAISDELGYKGKITWETIQNPYIPEGLYNMWEEQSKSKKDYAQLQEGIANVINNPSLQGAMGNAIGSLMQMPPVPSVKTEEDADKKNKKKIGTKS